MVRDEIRNAWPDQYLRIVEMVREQCSTVKKFCSENLENFIETANDHFKTVEKSILSIDLKLMKEVYLLREERKDT